jgi:hypothetical protein
MAQPPTPQIQALLEQWRALTEAESAGLAAGNWPAVARCQEAKQRLRAALTAAGGFRLDGTPLRQLLGDLVAAERRNLEVIGAHLREAGRQKEALDQVWQNLHRMRRAYAPRRRQCWQAFS